MYADHKYQPGNTWRILKNKNSFFSDYIVLFLRHMKKVYCSSFDSINRLADIVL